MAVDMVPAGKFNDVVVHCPQGHANEGVYLCQIKHKKTDNKPDMAIKKIDIFSDSGPYAIMVYLDSFCKIIQHRKFYRREGNEFPKHLFIKEMCLVTNINFDQALFPYLIKVKPEREWGPTEADSYKFNYPAIKNMLPDLEKYLSDQVKRTGDPPEVLKVTHPSEIVKTFFDLVVYQVNVPNVVGMKAALTKKIKLLAPYEMSDEKARRAYLFVLSSVKKMFAEKKRLDRASNKTVSLRKSNMADSTIREELLSQLFSRPKIQNVSESASNNQQDPDVKRGTDSSEFFKLLKRIAHQVRTETLFSTDDANSLIQIFSDYVQKLTLKTRATAHSI